MNNLEKSAKLAKASLVLGRLAGELVRDFPAESAEIGSLALRMVSKSKVFADLAGEADPDTVSEIEDAMRRCRGEF